MMRRRSAGPADLKKSKGLNMLAENIKKNFVRKPVRLVDISSSISSPTSDVSYIASKKSPVGRPLGSKTKAPIGGIQSRSRAASPTPAKPRHQPAPERDSLSPCPSQVPKQRQHMSPVVVLNAIPDKFAFKQPAPRTPASSRNYPHASVVKNSSNKDISANKRRAPAVDKNPARSVSRKPVIDGWSLKNAVSASDRGYSSDAMSNSGIPIRKRKEEMQTRDAMCSTSSESMEPCFPTKMHKYDDETSMDATADSFFSPGFHDSVSHCLTRRKDQLNVSLHQSFLSLGTLSFDTSFSTLPEWIAEAHKKRSQKPSQILAKIEYKSPPVVKKIGKEDPVEKDDKKLMPPPKGSPRKQAREKYDTQIRIQKNKDSVPEVKNWCFKFIKNGKIALQGYDITGKRGITSSEIVSVKNLRTITTAKSTYQLVGAIDRSRLEKENVFKTIASHFSHGFPADWKDLILRHSKEATGEETVQEEDSDADMGGKIAKEQQSNTHDQSEEVVIVTPNTDKFSAAPKTRGENLKNSRAHNSKQEHVFDNTEYSIDAAFHMVPSQSDESGSFNAILRQWSLRALEDERSNWKFCITGQADNGKMMSFNLVEWTVERPRLLKSSCCSQGFVQIELIGPPHFKSGEQPDIVEDAFEDGFPRNYLKMLEVWQSSLKASSVRRSSRAVVPPLKYWKGEKVITVKGSTFVRRGDFAKLESLPEQRKLDLAEPKIPRRRPNLRVQKKAPADISSDEDDLTATIKPDSNTMKALKKKAEFKTKLKDKATFKNQDFFDNKDELTSCDEFNAILSPAAKLKAAASNCLSPMANFVNSQSEASSSDTDDDREEEEVRDRRKKKSFDKFVFHETNKPKKRLQQQAKNSVLPTKSKFKRSEVMNLKAFLDKNLKRKKEYERRIRQGDDSDNSDFD